MHTLVIERDDEYMCDVWQTLILRACELVDAIEKILIMQKLRTT